MKLLPDARRIMTRSYSMWSMYFGLACLVAPSALWWGLEIESDPYPIGLAAFVFFIAGIIGRPIDQKRSGWASRLLFLGAFAFGAFMFFTSIGAAVVEDVTLPEPEQVVSGDQEARVTPAFAASPSTVIHVSGKMPASDQNFLEVAVPFIGKWEGLRLKAYRDVVGVWTVCYGETKGVKPGDTYTKAQCDAMLAREVLDYRRGLHRYFTTETRRSRLPRDRDVAYTSLAYNIGIAGAGKATATRRLNAGDVQGGCEAITWYNKAGGKVWRGLVRRRTDEYGLCMMGVAA